MLGLNLNTNMPFSPASGVAYHQPHLEEEVDAVTGKMDVIFTESWFPFIKFLLLCVYSAVIKG